MIPFLPRFVYGFVTSLWQVDFIDSVGYADLSAVQADEESRFIAEDTAFIGFNGEVFAIGELCSSFACLASHNSSDIALAWYSTSRLSVDKSSSSGRLKNEDLSRQMESGHRQSFF